MNAILCGFLLAFFVGVFVAVLAGPWIGVAAAIATLGICLLAIWAAVPVKIARDRERERVMRRTGQR